MDSQSTSLTLLERGRRDDPAAWRALATRYAPYVLGLGQRLGLSEADAQELVQESLTALFLYLRKLDEPFDRARGKFRALLAGIVRHKAADIRQQRLRQLRGAGPLPAKDAASARPSGADAFDEAEEHEWRQNLLREALEQVAREVEPTQFQAFTLVTLDGRPPAEVARLLGISRNAVYISKSRLIRRLREVLRRLERREDQETP
ncbi:MAG: sigma-70 family RNA polymerase sigma factor [Phycisphaerales bacterium]|nr:sigma-70 family RNA polymerase sigma factor [Phycisphaerales bacterium]